MQMNLGRHSLRSAATKRRIIVVSVFDRNVRERAGETPSSLKFSLPPSPTRSLSHPLILHI